VYASKECNVICAAIAVQVAVPIENFLQPDETDVGLVRLYCQALLSQSVTALRSPVPYIIAVHHVNRFIYLQQHATHRQLRAEIVRQLHAHKNQVSCFWKLLLSSDSYVM
jgi:hypothetical protein